jgi:hypothetical protein
MTPYEINILMHYYTRGDECDYEGDEPIAQETLDDFVARGWLKAGKKRRYDPTDKLECYCAALCMVPEPVYAIEWPRDRPAEAHD